MFTENYLGVKVYIEDCPKGCQKMTTYNFNCDIGYVDNPPQINDKKKGRT